MHLFAQLVIKKIAILKKIYNNILKIQKKLIKYYIKNEKQHLS